MAARWHAPHENTENEGENDRTLRSRTKQRKMSMNNKKREEAESRDWRIVRTVSGTWVQQELFRGGGRDDR